MKRLRGLGKSSAGKGILQISSASVIGQLAGVIALPFLTRIYSPEAFGVFAYITAVSLVLISVASLRLELTIPLPPQQSDSDALLRTGLVVSLVFSVVVAIAIAFTGSWIDESSDLELMPWLWFLPALVLLGAWYTLLSQKAIAHQDYKSVATRNVAQGLGTVVGQFGCALISKNAGGLLAGALFGRLVGIGSLLRKYRSAVLVRRPLAGSRTLIKRYKHFPLVYTPSALLNALGTSLPLLLFGVWYGAVAAGLLGVVQRVLAAPAALVSSAVSQVFLGELAQRVREGKRNNRPAYLKATWRLGLVGVLIPLMTIPLAPALTPLILGADWAEAGYYAQAISVVAGAAFIVSPLSTVFMVYETAWTNIGLDIVRIILIGAAALVVTTIEAAPVMSLWLLSGAMVLTYLCIWICGYKIVDGKTKTSNQTLMG